MNHIFKAKSLINPKPLALLTMLLCLMIFLPAFADGNHGTTSTTTSTHDTPTTEESSHDVSDDHHANDETMTESHDESKEESIYSDCETMMDDHHGDDETDTDHHDENKGKEDHSDCETMMDDHHDNDAKTTDDHHSEDTMATDDHHSGEGLLTDYVADTTFVLRSEIVDAETMAYVGLSEGIMDIRNPELAVDEKHIVEITLGNTTVDEHDLVIEFRDSKIHSEHVVFEEDVTTFAFKAETPGTYTYYCTVEGHREAGMEGVFLVKPHGH